MPDFLPTDVARHKNGAIFQDGENAAALRVSTKQQLASMMAELLGLEKVEEDDNFFMLGGHSLLGTQLIMRIRESFGVDVGIRAIFTHPTARDISTEIDRLLARQIPVQVATSR